MQLQFAGMDFTCVLDSLEKYQIPEKDCLLPLLSKSLGYAIVCGSVFLKVPQVCLCFPVCLCLSLRADSSKLASVLYLRDKYRGLKMSKLVVTMCICFPDEVSSLHFVGRIPS
jgi:hypothetical protein